MAVTCMQWNAARMPAGLEPETRRKTTAAPPPTRRPQDMPVRTRPALELKTMQTFLVPATAARAARLAAHALGLLLPMTGAFSQVPEDHLKSLAVAELKSL
jgi:hypothetical protein